MSLFRTKAINSDAYCDTGLRRCLRATDLTLLGIGAVIGAGIFVLTGVAAATQAGPALVVSFVLAGLACAFSAMAYAELASTVGGCGSAYGYAYAGLGEFVAWIIGWDLILEYGVALPAVAIGWSGYTSNALQAIGLGLPAVWQHAPIDGGIVNLPAILIIVVLALVLSVGVHLSAKVNALMVMVKLAAIAIFIGVAVFHVNTANWHPFAPFGWHGVVTGAALIFFAYIGFDAVSTAAEETVNPARDLPIGILGSLAICTLIYIAVAGLLTAIAPYSTLNVASPVADVLLRIGQRGAAGAVAVGAIVGLTTVMLVMYYGLSRIFLAMSRDGLLPPVFSAIHPRTKTPIRVILVSGVFMAAIAGFTPIGEVAQLVNIGTLAAFLIVCSGVIVLRMTRPELPRPFRTPGSPVVPLLGVATCLYLMSNLPATTWWRFVIWLVIGLVVYFSYSRKHSSLVESAQ